MTGLKRTFTVWVMAVLVTVTVAIRPSAYGGGQPFIGELMWVPYTFAPQGWANCDGQLLSIAQNTALFALIGTTYGGDGQTTFGLPDMRGRSHVHVGQGPGLSSYVLGENLGQEAVNVTTSNLPLHTHTLPSPSHTHAIPPRPATVMASNAAAVGAIPTGQVLAMAALGLGRGPSNMMNIYNAGPANVVMGAGSTTQAGTTGLGGVATALVGGSSPHENRQPYLVLRCVIATEGIFPSQNASER